MIGCAAEARGILDEVKAALYDSEINDNTQI